MAAQPWIWFRGHRMTTAVRDAILAAEQRAGFTFIITQGGFNRGGVLASAGTHDGDAADFRTWHLTQAQVAKMISSLRWAGFAAWYRTTSTAHYGVRPHGFAHRHVHAVPNGWGSPSSGAVAQAIAYRRGFDGLRAMGTDKGGPGHVSTWYQRTTPRRVTPPSATKPTPDPRTDIERLLDAMDEKQLRKIIREEADAALWAPAIPARQGTGDSWGNSTRHNAAQAAATATQALAVVRDLAKKQGVDVDEQAIIAGLKQALAPVIKTAVKAAVEAGGTPDKIADAVVTRMGAALIEG